METAKSAKLESRVGDRISRRARRQLMQIPWDQFHKAYEEYIRWQAFVLWARAIAELQEGVSSRLAAMLEKRCAGFMEELDGSDRPGRMGFRLLSWVHAHVFGSAKQEGWLDALVFYGFRDTRSQGYWTHWEHFESEWRKNPSAQVPTFPQWRRSALSRKTHGSASCAAVTKAVERYIDFEAFACWLRPLVPVPTIRLSARVAREMDQHAPGLRKLVGSGPYAAREDESKSWQRLFERGRDRILWRAKREGWLDDVLRQARVHPLHVRVMGYARLWNKSRAADCTSLPPSFAEWRKDAESYLEARRK